MLVPDVSSFVNSFSDPNPHGQAYGHPRGHQLGGHFHVHHRWQGCDFPSIRSRLCNPSRQDIHRRHRSTRTCTHTHSCTSCLILSSLIRFPKYILHFSFYLFVDSDMPICKCQYLSNMGHTAVFVFVIPLSRISVFAYDA